MRSINRRRRELARCRPREADGAETATRQTRATPGSTAPKLARTSRLRCSCQPPAALLGNRDPPAPDGSVPLAVPALLHRPLRRWLTRHHRGARSGRRLTGADSTARASGATTTGHPTRAGRAGRTAPLAAATAANPPTRARRSAMLAEPPLPTAHPRWSLRRRRQGRTRRRPTRAGGSADEGKAATRRRTTALVAPPALMDPPPPVVPPYRAVRRMRHGGYRHIRQVRVPELTVS